MVAETAPEPRWLHHVVLHALALVGANTISTQRAEAIADLNMVTKLSSVAILFGLAD